MYPQEGKSLPPPSAFVARRRGKHEKKSYSHQAGWLQLGAITSAASCWIRVWDSGRRAPSVLATGHLGCAPRWKGYTEDRVAVVAEAILSQYENTKKDEKVDGRTNLGRDVDAPRHGGSQGVYNCGCHRLTRKEADCKYGQQLASNFQIRCTYNALHRFRQRFLLASSVLNFSCGLRCQIFAAGSVTDALRRRHFGVTRRDSNVR